jgi:hypothetical protein
MSSALAAIALGVLLAVYELAGGGAHHVAALGLGEPVGRGAVIAWALGTLVANTWGLNQLRTEMVRFGHPWVLRLRHQESTETTRTMAVATARVGAIWRFVVVNNERLHPVRARPGGRVLRVTHVDDVRLIYNRVRATAGRIVRRQAVVDIDAINEAPWEEMLRWFGTPRPVGPRRWGIDAALIDVHWPTDRLVNDIEVLTILLKMPCVFVAQRSRADQIFHAPTNDALVQRLHALLQGRAVVTYDGRSGRQGAFIQAVRHALENSLPPRQPADLRRRLTDAARRVRHNIRRKPGHD